ncbi:unnamed protein product [Cuscuta campestris]|uniref:Uncharacterized protein n=1 Tax=Cuscuta campestris TaxID=132261 RepID=A0A484K601_9ASTE|nr:unnamed protein product [Cuscuta campestris]
MHARHRGPVTAYNRSNSMRMVGGGHVPASLRISPEGSIRGHHEMYSSEYRNYNRDGFGHVQPKHFPMRDPSPRRSDVFMEAGRMAAEYLVSKGLLPQSVLLGKGQNGNLRNYNPGFRTQEGGDMQPLPVGPVASRPSALSRLGNHVPDIVPGRKRYSDDYGAAGPNKGQFRGRRRNGYFKDSDWNRDTGRSGSYSKKSRASSPETDDCRVDSSVHQDEKKFAKEGSAKTIPETGSDANAACDSELALEKHNSVGDKASKESSTSSGKDLPPKDEAEDVQMSANMETSTSEVGESKRGDDNGGTDSHVELRVEEGTPTSKKGTDLLSLCGFENVPRRTRSSLTVRRSKVICDAAVTVEEEKDTNECAQPKEFEEIPLHDSFNQNCDTKSPYYGNPSVTPPEERNASVHPVEEDSTSSVSFTDDTIMDVPEKIEELEEENEQEQNMKPLELTSPDDVRSDCFFYHSGLEEKEKLQNLHDPNGNIMQTDDFEEKQLFPSAFKTCDLNLMEAADVNENHDVDTDLIFPSIIESRKEPVPIDLSMNNSCGIPDKYNNCGFDGKYVEVIDLENDSEQEGKPFDDQLGSSITELTSRDGYANNNANIVNEIADVHDGYGLMLSELLGNDIPNCSSAPGGEDMSVLHNDMGLHNGEGLLGDDDSIYMSLGEIPMSFPWEQPPQEYRRPF